MNSREAFTHLVTAIIIMLVLSLIAYYIGGNYIGNNIITEANNAVAAGTKLDYTIPNLEKGWKPQYVYLILYMGLTAAFILILWVALTHWLLRPSGSTGLGKRWLWGLLGIILAVLCVAGPYIFRYYWNIPCFDDERLSLLFFVCYCLVGYWGGSIFVTSDTYKYTPIFAGFFK